MSPFLDDRGRLFGRVSIIDLLVLAALIALVALAFMRYTGGGAGAEVQDVRLVLVVERIRDTTVAQFEEGARVQDDTGTVLGTIERVTQKRNLVEVPNDEGELTAQESPIFWDVEVTILGTGRVSDFSVRIGAVTFAAGKQLVIRSRGLEARATVRTAKGVG